MGEQARETDDSSGSPGQIAAGRRILLLVALLVIALPILVDPRPVAAAPGQLGGVVSYDNGSPAVDVDVDLYTAQPGGGRSHFLRSTSTDARGRYALAVDDGCYVIVIVAPDGQRFRRTGSYFQASVCLTDGIADRTVDGLLRNAAATVSGRTDLSTGGPVPQVVVDLFNSNDGRRTDYLFSTTTDSEGSYTISMPAAGCYQLVFIAPRGNTFVSGSRYDEVNLCIDDGDALSGVDAVVASSNSSQIGGRIEFQAGTGAEGVTIDLFRATGDGSRGVYLRSAVTDLGGRYSFDLAAGCYTVVMIAPPGETFASSGQFQRRQACVSLGDVVTSLDGSLIGVAEPPTNLNVIELEIARLTNELRGNPSGPLARRNPMPECIDEEFYDISLDSATGHPEAVPTLELSELVSVEMARAWAVDMQQRDSFDHRTSSSQQQIYDRLDISASAWGENIAWFSGYTPQETARIHFEGWRESDTGHYCSLITPRFTNVGVGEHRVGDESWAVQNFYASR